MSSPVSDLRQIWSQVPDPRGRQGTRHSLSAILTAVICAVLSGANGYKTIAQARRDFAWNPHRLFAILG